MAQLFRAFLFVTVAFGVAQSGAAQPVVVDLGTLGGTSSEAYAINDSGQVVGYSKVPGDISFHAFSWTAAGGMVDLGTLGGNYSYASAVSAAGQVVGTSYLQGDINLHDHAFSWTSASGLIDLGTLGGTQSQASAVNASGLVVGFSSLPDGSRHAFLWTAAGRMVDLGTLGGLCSIASAVNGSGQVVGMSCLKGTAVHAFSWTAGGGMVDLGTFGGRASSALALSASGQVVGYSDRVDGSSHAFSWTAAGGMVDLGTLGGANSYATAVNDTGQVVGYAALPGNSSYHAFSWTPAGGMVDLVPLGGTNGSLARAVNFAGQVVGRSYLPDNTSHHAFSWTLAGGLVDLGTLGGQYSTAWAVNTTGQVVGASDLNGVAAHAVLWDSTVSPPHFTSTAPNITVGTDPGVCTAQVVFGLPTATGIPAPTVTAAPPSGSIFPLDRTTVSVTARNGIPPDAMQTFAVTVNDTAAPRIDGTPANMIVDAIGPAGTPVTYTPPTATDNCPGVTLTRTTGPPSGTIFPMGDTTVTFRATDGAGTITTSSFTVHVRDGAEQVAVLAQQVVGVGPGASLYNKVVDIERELAAGNLADACGQLGAFLNEVKAQTGKKIPAGQAAELIAAATRIRAVIGC